jgi:transcriptional regulator with XRE-family HTH domain
MKVMFTREIPGLGAKIKTLRVASGRQLSQLAAEAQISVPHWNRIENEKVKVLPEETLKGIAKALGVSLEDQLMRLDIEVAKND